MATKYYSDCLEKGIEYQDFISIELIKHGIVIQNIQSKKYQKKKENLIGLEIKFDDKYKTTGNLYIETHERPNTSCPDFWESGILRQDENWLYGIGDYSIFYIFSKKKLRTLYKKHTDYKVYSAQNATSRGILIPKEKAELWCDRLIVFDPAEN